jgi:signal transduction histidine kinase/CheY-like chemotaxis protein
VLGSVFYEFHVPENREKVEQLINEFRNGKQSLHLIETLHDRVVDNTFHRIENAESSYEGILLSAFDITERVRAEEEKKILEAQLQRAEKMELVGTLAGGVAHDLNNILSGLVAYPDLLLLDLPENSPLRAPILAMQESGKKAAAIVQDLLTLARRGVSVAEVANLNDIITDYLNSPEYDKLIAYHPGVQVETSLETRLLNTLGSPVHLSKCVMNLVSNAAEALPDGGKIIITTKNQYIDRPIAGYHDVREGDCVVLSVADNGIGIPADDLERIFEPFYTKKVMGRSGTGLGMAVVWGTVKDHSGYINVKSAEGKGTTFELYFPVTRKEAVEEEPVKSIEEYKGNGGKILVIDDVKEQRELAAMLLTKLGYSVSSVSSGEEAVEYMKTNSANILVLDMIMAPGIDGLHTYKRILELHPGQKAIIASGYSETDRVKEAQRLGAGQYVKKPYTLEKVGLAVTTELQK